MGMSAVAKNCVCVWLAMRSPSLIWPVCKSIRPLSENAIHLRSHYVMQVFSYSIHSQVSKTLRTSNPQYGMDT